MGPAQKLSYWPAVDNVCDPGTGLRQSGNNQNRARHEMVHRAMTDDENGQGGG